MSQYDRVKAVLQAATKPLALCEIRRRILMRFSVSDSEAAISARIRDIRHDLQKEGFTVASQRAAPGVSNPVYWLTRLTDEKN